MIIALVLVVVTGMAAVGCNGVDDNGDITNGDVPNGDGLDEPDLSGLGLVVDCDQNAGEEPGVGDKALDFRCQDASGQTFFLSDFRGKLVILNFWATWCSYCNKQLPYLQQLHDEGTNTDLVLLTLSKGEEPNTVATFMQDEGLSFPVVLDREQEVSAQYHVTGVPTTFFIDEEGVIQFIKVGYFHSLGDIADIVYQITGTYIVEPDLAEPDLSAPGLAIDCDQNTSGEKPEAGETALDFRFQDAEGQTFALSDFRGRLVILNFWATWCGYCNKQLPHIQQLYDELPEPDVVLLTLSKGEEPATVATFMQDEGLSFPVIVDSEQKVSAQYQVTGVPTTFFIDEEGIVQFIKVGYFHSLEDIEEILSQFSDLYVSEPEVVEPDPSGLEVIIDCDQNPGGEKLEASDTALDFRFLDAEGQTHSLNDFRGKPVVLGFWATWCPYCKKQLPHVQQLYDEWPATEVVLLTISKGEEPATVATFMQDEGYSFPVIVDIEQKATAQYGVSGIPATFFIDEEGIIQVVKVGYFHTYEDIVDALNQITGQ